METNLETAGIALSVLAQQAPRFEQPQARTKVEDLLLVIAAKLQERNADGELDDFTYGSFIQLSGIALILASRPGSLKDSARELTRIASTMLDRAPSAIAPMWTLLWNLPYDVPADYAAPLWPLILRMRSLLNS